MQIEALLTNDKNITTLSAIFSGYKSLNFIKTWTENQIIWRSHYWVVSSWQWPLLDLCVFFLEICQGLPKLIDVVKLLGKRTKYSQFLFALHNIIQIAFKIVMFHQDIQSNLHISKLSGKMLLNGFINEKRCSLKTDLTCVSILYQNLQKKPKKSLDYHLRKQWLFVWTESVHMNKRID